MWDHECFWWFQTFNNRNNFVLPVAYGISINMHGLSFNKHTHTHTSEQMNKILIDYDWVKLLFKAMKNYVYTRTIQFGVICIYQFKGNSVFPSII